MINGSHNLITSQYTSTICVSNWLSLKTHDKIGSILSWIKWNRLPWILRLPLEAQYSFMVYSRKYSNLLDRRHNQNRRQTRRRQRREMDSSWYWSRRSSLTVETQVHLKNSGIAADDGDGSRPVYLKIGCMQSRCWKTVADVLLLQQPHLQSKPCMQVATCIWQTSRPGKNRTSAFCITYSHPVELLAANQNARQAWCHCVPITLCRQDV